MRDVRKIAMKYIKSSCIFDLLAIVPFEFILTDKGNRKRILRLLKLFRVPRLVELINVERFR